MNKKQIIGMIVAAVLFVGIGASSVLVNSLSESLIQTQTGTWETMMNEAATVLEDTISTPDYDYIGTVSVVGTIQQQMDVTGLFDTISGYQHNTMMDFIDIMMTDDYNKGILLYIDSPGGTVYESEELYSKILEYQETTGRPVWTYMAHYAASGGYYVTASADKIYANLNTTTGSIGVIMSGYDMTGLYEKLGIKQVNITSGDNKASTFTDEQIEIYKSIIDESYERFTSIIAEGRGLPIEDVKALADGRIYSATQAKELGLVDAICTYDEMRAEMEAELGVMDYYEPETTDQLFMQLFGKIEEIIPKSEAEILTDLTEEFGNGVPMYYAEQLQ